MIFFFVGCFVIYENKSFVVKFKIMDVVFYSVWLFEKKKFFGDLFVELYIILDSIGGWGVKCF